MTLAQKISLLHGNGNASAVHRQRDRHPVAVHPEPGPAGRPGRGRRRPRRRDPDAVRQRLGRHLRPRATSSSTARRSAPSSRARARTSRSARRSTSSATRAGAGRSRRSARTRTCPAQMAAADIQGIQSQGVMAEVKHAAVYNIENPAGTVDRGSPDAPGDLPARVPGRDRAVRAGRRDVRVRGGQQRPGLPEPGAAEHRPLPAGRLRRLRHLRLGRRPTRPWTRSTRA